MNDLEKKYILKYNNLEIDLNNLNNNLNYNSNNIILDELKNDLINIHENKSLVNKSKSLMIKINKSKNLLNNKKKLEKFINKQIKLLDTNNIDTDILISIINSFKNYLNIKFDDLNNKLETILFNSDLFNDLDFFYIINHKKNKKNNLQKLINAFDFKNCYLFHPKIFFFDNNIYLDNQDTIVEFIKKFNFNYRDLPHKLLKRGFLFEIDKNNKPFILKFQPNKSYMEILMNKYLSKFNQLHEFILFPKYFFVNKNNSYFYIIEKYNCDLFTYIKKKNEHLPLYEIISIIKFLIKFIYHLHDLNIIYADIKLENMIINSKNNQIIDMKFIDFDVSLFDQLPNEFLDFDPKIIQLLKNKKPRGTKFYQSPNEEMKKSNDIFSIGVFIIILLYKNTMKIFNNNINISSTLKSKIIKRLVYYKNKLDTNESKIKLIKYIFRIYNDKRFRKYWNSKIKIRDIYFQVKKCINQTIDIHELYNCFS